MLNLDGSKLAHAALNTEPETLYNPYSDDEGPHSKHLYDLQRLYITL